LALSFAELKKSRSTSFDKLNAELDKLNSKSFSKTDERFWQPTVDKAGNGYAVVRFLDSPEGEDVPFIRRWDHGFTGTGGGWYIELSLNTIGKDDPVSDMNRKLWAEGEGSAGRKIVSGHGTTAGTKRRMHYISNILVIEDPAHPENNGKVFLYQYGKKIFDKLNDLMNPKFPDEQPVNPFDLWEGADFKIKIRQVEGFRNYDKSEFDDPSPIADSDDKIEKIWKSAHSLQSFLDPKLFKSYEELEKKMLKVLGMSAHTSAERSVREDIAEKTTAPKEAKSASPRQESGITMPSTEEDADEEGLEFFQKLANK
jgi:hypothetical protein